MKNTNEVNVSNPTQAQQMSMNPYTFINIYKTGYNSSLKNAGSNYSRLGNQQHFAAANVLRLTEHLQHPQYISAAFHIL